MNVKEAFKCRLLKDIIFNAHCSRRYVARGAKMKVPTPDPHTEIPWRRRQYHCLTWIGIRIEKTCSESSLWVKIVADSNNGWQIDQAKTEATQDSIEHLRLSIMVTNQFVVDLLNNDDHKIVDLLTIRVATFVLNMERLKATQVITLKAKISRKPFSIWNYTPLSGGQECKRPAGHTNRATAILVHQASHYCTCVWFGYLLDLSIMPLARFP